MKRIHYGYIIALACGLLTLISSTAINAAGIFYVPVTTEFGVPMSSMSFVLIIFNLSYFVMMPLINKSIEKFDIRVTLTAGVLLMAGGFALRAVSLGMMGFYVSGFLHGNGFAILVNIAAPILANTWFRKKQATIIAFAALWANIGGFIFSPIGAMIIEQSGWRACCWMWTAIILVIGIPCAAFIVRGKPEDMGLQAYGISDDNSDNAESAASAKGLDASFVFKTAAFWFMGIAIGLDCFGDSFGSFVNAFAQNVGLTAVQGGLLVSFLSAGGIFSKIIMGFICDFRPRLGAIMTNSFGAGSFFVITALAIIGNLPFLIFGVLLFLFGFAYSASNIAFSSFVADIFGAKDFSKIWPTACMFQGAIGAVASLLYGVVIDTLGYTACSAIVATGYFVSLIMILLAAKCANKYRSMWH